MRRQTIVDAAMTARFLIALSQSARQPEAERAVRPRGEIAPAEIDQPGQADQQQRERRERRADATEQMTEARGQRMAEAIDADHVEQRRLQRAARHQHADEAQPKTDRAGTAQACAAWQHRLHEAPQKRNEPDGRPAEPAENYRVHTRHQRMTNAKKRNPSSLNRRSPRLRRPTQVCLRPKGEQTGARSAIGEKLRLMKRAARIAQHVPNAAARVRWRVHWRMRRPSATPLCRTTGR